MTLRRARRAGSTIGIVLLVIIALIACAGIGAYIGYRTSGFGHRIEFLAPAFEGRDVVYILALGEDDTGCTKSKPRGLSDTVILVRVDFLNKRVAALSIPRDTKIALEGYGEIKINAAHVHGGPVLACMAVEQLTGIKPDYYVKTNLKGFRKSVDILGGVEIDVEKDMHYTDRWGGLYINLHKGRQVLNGEKAMEYVRFRHDKLGDITRVQRQQKFLKVFVATMLSPMKLPKLPWVVKALMDNVDTTLTVRDAVYLAEFAKGIRLSEVKMASLPETPQYIGGISYMIPDSEVTYKVVQELFFPKPPMPKLEVLNGTGIPGAAQKVAEALKERGYEVTAVGNAGSFEYASTELISHKGEAGVNQLASIVNSGAVKYDEDKSAKADITVIVGKDCTLISSGS
jgi:LCP family protein required for cell wall assembly